MKFKGLRRFSGSDLASAVKYLGVEMSVAMKDLFEGLKRLTFEHNFDSFTVTEIIAAGAEAKIINRLGTSALKRVIVKQTGAGPISDGTSIWTSDFVYLKNHGASEVTVTAIFMR